jgi:hypothetical protein
MAGHDPSPQRAKGIRNTGAAWTAATLTIDCDIGAPEIGVNCDPLGYGVEGLWITASR